MAGEAPAKCKLWKEKRDNFGLGFNQRTGNWSEASVAPDYFTERVHMPEGTVREQEAHAHGLVLENGKT